MVRARWSAARRTISIARWPERWLPRKARFSKGSAGVDTLARSTHNSAFAELSAEVRDELLTTMDNGAAAGFPNARAFFNRVRRLTLEGMFSDPYYGGNTNFAGLGYDSLPGAAPCGRARRSENETPASSRIAGRLRSEQWPSI